MAAGNLDWHKPTAARVQNALLNGRDNTSADRAAAQELAARHPILGVLNRHNRRFTERTVRHLAADGIRQFLDLGCGLPVHPDGEPRWPMTHETAGAGAQVIYVDNDPVVYYRVRAAAAAHENVTVIKADLACPGSPLISEQLHQMTARPAAVIFGSVLHYWPPGAAQSIVARYTEHLAAGSAVVITCAHLSEETAAERRAVLPGIPYWNYTAEDVTSFFTAAGLRLASPVADVAPVTVAGQCKTAVVLGGTGWKP